MTRARPVTVLRAGLVLGVAAALAAPAGAWAQEDPNLDQTIAEAQPIVHGGEHVLDVGHVDMGPRFDDGQWRFLVHDDAAKGDSGAQSVWRYPGDTVFQVLDDARLEVPDDPAYEFLGADPGAPAWVIPQTQNPDVVWLGWNTHDPEVMRTIDRGITLALDGVEGPGTVTVYLQSGSFGEPQLLWDSRKVDDQPIWVEMNTHTHANWVFTEAGVYLLRVTASADLVDGSTVSDTQLLRFAVGGATDPAEAFAAEWAGPTGSDEAGQSAGVGGEEAPAPGQGGLPFPLLVVVLIGASLLLVIVVAVVVVRGGRLRRRALGGASDGGTP